MKRHRSTATARSLQTEANAGIHAAGKPAASSRYPNPWGRADRIFKLPELCPKGWLTKASRCSASVPVNYGFSSKQQLSSGAWAVPKEASKMPSALQQVPGCLMVLGQGLVLPKLQRGPSSHRAATSCPNPTQLQHEQPGAKGIRHLQSLLHSQARAGESELHSRGRESTRQRRPSQECRVRVLLPSLSPLSTAHGSLPALREHHGLCFLQKKKKKKEP